MDGGGVGGGEGGIRDAERAEATGVNRREGIGERAGGETATGHELGIGAGGGEADGPEALVVGGVGVVLRNLGRDGESLIAVGAEEDGTADGARRGGGGEQVGVAVGGIGAGGQAEEEDGFRGGEGAVLNEFIEGGEVVLGVQIIREGSLGGPRAGVAIDAVQGGDAVAGSHQVTGEDGGFGGVKPRTGIGASLVEEENQAGGVGRKEGGERAGDGGGGRIVGGRGSGLGVEPRGRDRCPDRGGFVGRRQGDGRGWHGQ